MPQASIDSVIKRVQTRVEERADPYLRFAQDVHEGLSHQPRTLPSEYLYDERGSILFDEICRQPEYYLTRTEAAILEQFGSEIANLCGDCTVVELGAGTSVKSPLILRPLLTTQDRARYIALDVSESALRQGQQHIKSELPDVESYMLCGQYMDGFTLRSYLERVLYVLLGSTLGNFDQQELTDFFRGAAARCQPGDHFLLGVDLHKERGVLEDAYNDQAGVTAAFTCNLFERLGREVAPSFDPSVVRHVAFYAEAQRRIEIYGEFQETTRIELPLVGHSHVVEAGERVRTEISRKFELEVLGPQLAQLGFATKRVFVDKNQYFGLLLLVRSDDAGTARLI